MDLTVGPEGLLQHLAQRLDLAPTPAAQAFFPMMSARSVMAGVRLGVHAELAQGPRTAAELAAKLGLQPSGAARLLEVLESLGHLRRSGDRYHLTAPARRWLDPASPTYVGNFVEFNYLQWEWWSQLEDALKGNGPPDLHTRPPDDPTWALYVRAMFELARLSAAEIASRIPVPSGARRVIDLGGGHGWFAAELCRRHPGMTATVLDLPGSARAGRELIAAEGFADRVVHVEGDMLRADLGGPYDVALCFQVLHHLGADRNRELLARIHAALRPGGTLAVLEYFVNPHHHPPGFAALVGLHYFVTSGASAWRRSDLAGWLAEAGFDAPRFRQVRRLPIQTLAVARRR